ncbi:MAG: SurA N-terminal domain-containing protein [Methylococcaceae bacterium]|nr:SurA N-terminal domain-containing protein [Methylococcaceae bacterium]
MLQAIRERAHGIFAWVMLIAIGVPFGLWGIQNYIDTGKEKPAAVVGDREIFDREVTKAYEQSLNNLVGIDDFDEKKLRQDALERLIREEVLAQSAEAKSLAVSDTEARSFVQTLPYFQTDGKFDKDKYKVMLSAQGMTPNQFVAQIRRALLMEQFQRSVLDSAFVTKGELETLLRLKNQERDLEYVKIPLAPVTRNFTDAEIEAWYQQHLADYRNPEKVSVEYLALNLEDLAREVQVSEEDLHKLYEEQKASFGTPERRKISHILIAVEGSGEAAEKAAQAKAESIRERLVKGEDFVKLAQEASSDSVSGKSGGDLGFLDKDAQEEAFTKAAESLNEGEISAPVKTSFGYHLIKLTQLVPAKIKSFEEVREELRKLAQHNGAETSFYEKGQKLTEQTFEQPDTLEPAARQLNLKVQVTGPFTREAGEGLAAEEAVRKAAFSEEVLGGRNSDPIELGNEKAVVLRIKDHQPATDKPLAEVREAVIARLRDQEARAETAKRSQQLQTAVRSGKSLAEAAKGLGLETSKSGFIRRENDKLPPELVRAAFNAARPAADKATPGEVALPDGSQFVFRITAVKDGAANVADAKEQTTVSEFLMRNEAQREFGSFVERLRELADVTLKSTD